MDRIHADQIIQPKPTSATRKGKNEAEGVALYGIEDFIFSSFVEIETFDAGKYTQANKIKGRAGEQEWTGYALIQIMQPKPMCTTWKEKNATAGIALNGIEDDSLLF